MKVVSRFVWGVTSLPSAAPPPAPRRSPGEPSRRAQAEVVTDLTDRFRGAPATALRGEPQQRHHGGATPPGRIAGQDLPCWLGEWTGDAQRSTPPRTGSTEAMAATVSAT